MASKYHLYQRDKGKLGKSAPWYYWYWEGDKQVRKTTGCTKRKGQDGAEEFIDRLEVADRERALGTIHGRMTLREFASGMYLPGAAHLERAAEKGAGIKDHTRAQHRRNLVRLIEWFGDDYVDELTEDYVEDHLAGRIEPAKETQESAEHKTMRLEIKGRSASWKNSHLYTLSLVLGQAKRKRRIAMVPKFEPFKRRAQRQSALEPDEMEALFPECPGALECLWRGQGPRSHLLDPPGTGLKFGAMFALMLSAGLRSGEGRGAWLDQYRTDCKAFVVSRALDDEMVLGYPKEGDDEDPRVRVSLLPDRTIKILEWYLNVRGREPGYLFLYHDHPIDGGYLDDRWARGLEAAGISTEGRKLTPHALRYTYTTVMRHRIPEPILNSTTGHRSKQMTDLYDNPAIAQMIRDLVPYQVAINSFWDAPVSATRDVRLR